MALDETNEDLTPEEKEQRLRAREEALLRQAAATPVLGTGEETDEQEATAAKAAGVDVDVLRGRRLEKRFEDVFGRPLLRSGLRPFDSGEATTPPSMMRPKTLTSDAVRGELGLGRVGRVLREPVDMPETVPSLSMPSGVPAKTTDFASLQKRMSPGALKAPEAQPIPVANAPSGSDAAAPVTSALPSVGPQNPARPADSSGRANLPAPSSEGAGGDALGRLSLGQALTRALEGSGSIIAGRDLRSGAADTLGERMKQIEALRAKREERSADVAQEQAQYEGANLATLATQLAAFKDRPDIVAALQNLKPGAKYTKPSEFIKSAYQAVTNPPTVAAKEAAGKLAGERTETVKQERPAKVGLVENKVRSEQERTKLLREQAGLTAAKAEALRAEKEKGALIKEAGPSKGPYSDPKLELRRKAAFTKETTAAGKLYTEPTQQLASLERESGDLIDGRTPAWWNPANVALLQKGVTSGLPDDALKFAKKYYAVINPLRHGLFGSALTDGEQKAFADQIEIALLRGPRDLGMALKELMSMQKDKTKLRLGFILNEAPDLAEAWLKTSGFSDSIKGTSFEDMFPQPAAAKTVRIQRKADGKIVRIPAADKARYLADPRFQEAP